jgi:hypothetical protein
MSSFDSVARYQRNPDIVLREEDDDGALLFNPDTCRLQVINDTGVFLWKLLDTRRTIAELETALREAYDSTPDNTILKDIEVFIKEMTETNTITLVEQE